MTNPLPDNAGLVARELANEIGKALRLDMADTRWLAARLEEKIAPVDVTAEALAKTNADLAEQVALKTNVTNYFKKVHADAISELSEAATALEASERNLEGRDKFIVDKGLWLEFVDQLPRATLRNKESSK